LEDAGGDQQGNPYHIADPSGGCREGIHKKRPRRDDPKGLDERIDMKT
jgi:hypothetical protein